MLSSYFGCFYDKVDMSETISVLSKQKNKTKKGTKMHGYFLTRRNLRKKFPEFIGGQFLIVSSKLQKADLKRFMEINSDADLKTLLQKLGIVEGGTLSYRGEIERLEMSSTKREIRIHFKWLCLQRKGIDYFKDSQPKWFPIHKIDGCNQCMHIAVTGGYFPKRGERMKVWTTLNMITASGEYCRFYKPGDPDNLVAVDGDFVCPTPKVS